MLGLKLNHVSKGGPGFTPGYQVHIAGLVVYCGISDAILSEMTWFIIRPAICIQARDM